MTFERKSEKERFDCLLVQNGSEVCEKEDLIRNHYNNGEAGESGNKLERTHMAM